MPHNQQQPLPRRRKKAGRYSGAGIVLIELLIAAAIAALLIGTVLAVYISVLNTAAFQNRWRNKAIPAAEALDFLIRDFSCLAVPFGITNQPFAAAFSDNKGEPFKMSFYSCFPAGKSNEWRSYSISRINYSLQRSGTPDEFVLVRESIPFRVPSRNPSAAGREKWGGIKQVEIIFYDGSGWTNQWDTGKATNAVPQAVQFRLLTGGCYEFKSEVIVPAAKQITPQKKNP